MSKFRDVKTLQKFAAAHASIHNHFNLERHLTRRETFKQNRAQRWPNGVSWRRERRNFRCFEDWFALD